MDEVMEGKLDDEMIDKLEANHFYVWVEKHLQSSHVPSDDKSKTEVNIKVFQKTFQVGV